MSSTLAHPPPGGFAVDWCCSRWHLTECERTIGSITPRRLETFTLRAFAPVAGASVAIASLAAAPTASADTILPVPGSESADLEIAQLKSLGYNVSINWLEGHPNVPLYECQVTGITGLPAQTKSTPTFDTVYVDVTCPNAK